MSEEKPREAFEITGLDYRGSYKILYLKTVIDGETYYLTAVPQKNFAEIKENSEKWVKLQEGNFEVVPKGFIIAIEEVNEKLGKIEELNIIETLEQIFNSLRSPSYTIACSDDLNRLIVKLKAIPSR